MSHAALNEYRASATATASRERILIMLFDGAVNFTTAASEHLAKNNLPAKGVYISKAQAIINELHATLNHEVGGELSKRLEQLYLYLGYELTRANIHNDQNALANAMRVLDVLRQSFVEAVASLKSDQQAAGAN